MRTWIVLTLAAGVACAQSYQPAPDEMSSMRDKLAQLAGRLDRLKGRDPALVADVEVYRKAAEWILRYPEEFYTKAYVANTVKVLDHGIARAEELEGGKPSWPRYNGRLVRAYRSAVDGSVQPYALIIPELYRGSRIRLDVVLHGRGATLNEVSFIAAHDSATPVPRAQDFIQLEVFGRGNNAYRWAGEADVYEALADVRKHYGGVDPARFVLRGFSMGGAGAWHIGLHHPSDWVAMEAGAGFTETKIYAKLHDVPPYQEKTLHIYDAVDYSRNAFNLAVVGYGGEIDPQLQGSTNIREELTRDGFHFKHEGLNWFGTDLRALFLVGPQTAHKFHPDSKKTSDELMDRAAEKGEQPNPDRIRFVTWTPRFHQCFWVFVNSLERQYERAEVDAERTDTETTVHTKNVAVLRLVTPGSIVLDGKKFAGGRAQSFEKSAGEWALAKPSTGLRKTYGLQGPIDDAFMGPFLCVRPTGQALSMATANYARRALDGFAKDFAKYFRGDIRIKDDRDVTESDISGYNLVLFGDPGSNSLIARALPKLPLRWTAETIAFGSARFAAAGTVPVLIYPNPLNPARYIVINSGHTFHEADLKGTNALLYPRLGDYAVVSASDGAVKTAGLFDEQWRIP